MYLADNTMDKIKPLFDNFYDSMLFSYFDGIFGAAYCDNLEFPKCAVIASGDFYFLAGEISCCEEIMKIIGNNRWAVIVPDKTEWLESLNKCGKQLEIVSRYHTCPPEENFDLEKLQKRYNKIFLHKNMLLEEINETYYYKALKNEWSQSFVCNYENYEDFKQHGFGFVVTQNGEILSGTSTYSYYNGGVEIEVSTDYPYRLQGLASITSAKFLAECVKRKLTPHWDARNTTSLSIAEKMGFIFKDKYTAFEFIQSQF